MKGTIKLDQILCPVVPTDRSDEGLRCAIALARARDAKLFVLSCVAGSLSRLEARVSIKKSIERSVDLHNISVETAPLDWEPIIVEGSHPAEVITREAVQRKVGLIVMSSRHRPYAAALLGSTAETVSRTAPCPVLVTRFEGGRSAKLTHSIEFKTFACCFRLLQRFGADASLRPLARARVSVRLTSVTRLGGFAHWRRGNQLELARGPLSRGRAPASPIHSG